MFTNKSYTTVSDFTQCKQALKNPTLRTTNMGALIEQVSAATGETYPWLYRYACTSPFSLNDERHQQIRRSLASYFSARRLKTWSSVFDALISRIIKSYSEKFTIDLLTDIVAPITTECTLYALGLDTRVGEVCEEHLEHLLQLTDFNRPLKVKDFARLNHAAQTLGDAIYNHRLHKCSDDKNELDMLKDNDFYNFLRIKYALSQEEICSYISAILAAGVSTKHTLANVFIEYFKQPLALRKSLFSEHSVEAFLENSLFLAGGVQTVYRVSSQGELFHINIAEANLKQHGCPFKQNESKQKSLAFGFGTHKCIGEMLSRRIMTLSVEIFYRIFPRAHVESLDVTKFYTHSLSKRIIINLKEL